MLLSRPQPCPPLLHSKTLHLSCSPVPTPPQPCCASLRKPPSRSHLRASVPAAQEVLPKSAIQKIAEKLRGLGYLEEAAAEDARTTIGRPGSAGEIFIPTPKELPRRRVGHTIDTSWSTPENPVPIPGSGLAITRFHEVRRELGLDTGKVPPTPTPPMVAELTIPAHELRRLRRLGIRLEKKLRLKVGKAGITEGIVNSIHERWRRSELVKITCEDLCRMNMKRTHEILERKTGGLVIWRSGSIIVLYRGANYEYPYFSLINPRDGNASSSSSEFNVVTTAESSQGEVSSSMARTTSLGRSSFIPVQSSLVLGVGSANKVRFQLPGEVELGEEVDKVLEGLGPRFADWWGCEPLPVDADLLPAVVPGYRKPFRLLPFGLKPKLTDREMTILRRLGRPLPCHFVLGRNRNLQGLALSIVKLWEKSEIAKIAIKKGARNTNTELMANELKQLTGGTVLSRDKDYIVLYRGKDFLPSAVSVAIEERRKFEMHKQKQKLEGSFLNAARVDDRLSSSVSPTVDAGMSTINSTSISRLQDGVEEEATMTKARFSTANQPVERMQAKLSHALEKKEKAERLLKELEQSSGSSKPELDKEAISEEERFMLRKVGLRMKAFLLLGRRGAFDGTVENMHLHWKYRELVKIISKDRCIEHIHRTARILETASGGILVAVQRVNKGHAIIVYRGKNYRRPTNLRPRTLLNKKEALKHSLEAQRHQSLKLHVLKLSRDIDKMKHQLVDGRNGNDTSLYLSDPGASRNTEGTGASTITKSSFTLDDKQVIASDDKNPFSIDGAVLPFAEPDTGAAKEFNDETNGQFILSLSGDRNIQKQSCFSSSASDEASEPSPSNHDLAIKKDDMKGEQNARFPKMTVLSNKERLILRKQALKMKRRPIFAIGRNNIITGVSKAIVAHFKKYPLAIVNVKGRAKGTSIHELVLQLEHATGAVMISQEPNKVILYRGWHEQGPLEMNSKSISGMSEEKLVISTQLMDAISLECGEHASQQGVTV